MTTSHEGVALHAVRADEPLTAADAVAWFAPGTPSGQQVIGYVLSARAATWLRVGPTGAIDTVHKGDVLAEAYEMVLFDGRRELRWLRTPDRRGPAVALGEDPATLPPGSDVTAAPPPRRGDIRVRLLAGTPAEHPVAGWTTLGSDRYASTYLPLTFTGGEVLTVRSVEYLTEDEHGNIDVADTILLGLHATTREAVRTVTAATSHRGTAA